MAVEFISPFQKYSPTDYKGLVTTNNLGQMYMIEPYLIDKMIKPIFYVNDSADEWLKFINQFPTQEVPTERSLEWMLQGRTEKNIPLLAASVASAGGAQVGATDKAGLGKGRFFMGFPEAYFDRGHVIVGMNPDLYKVRIAGQADEIGSTFWYECELVANSLSTFIPYDELAVNTRWSIDYTLTEYTLSKEGTGVSHTSPFRMAVEMSFMRKEYTVPGSMIDEGKNNPLAFDFYVKDSNGKPRPESVWINKLDFDYRQQFAREMSRLLLFGTSNKLPDGSYYNEGLSGYSIKAGPGLRQQIAPANILKENKFNLQFFLDFLRQLSFGKLPEDKRKFMIVTGEWGFADFTKEVENIPGVKSGTAMQNAASFAYGQGLGSKIYQGSAPNMSYRTPQFTKFYDIQGIEIGIMHNPMYDDTVRNKKYHPSEPGLLESRRMTILDFGTDNGESNIVRLVPKGRAAETHSYIAGLRHPFSPGGTAQNPQPMASRVDGYEIHSSWTGGIAIKNPMRCGELIIDTI